MPSLRKKRREKQTPTEESFGWGFSHYRHITDLLEKCMDFSEWPEALSEYFKERRCDEKAVNDTLDQVRDRKLGHRGWSRFAIRMCGNLDRLKTRPLEPTLTVGNYAENAGVRLVKIDDSGHQPVFTFMPVCGVFAGLFATGDFTVKAPRLIYMTRGNLPRVRKEELLGMHFEADIILSDGKLTVSGPVVTPRTNRINGYVRGSRYQRPSYKKEPCPFWKSIKSCFFCDRRQLPLEGEKRFGCYRSINPA